MHVLSLVKFPRLLLKLSSEKKIWACLGQLTQSKFDEICWLASPIQISTISMHIPSLVRIHWRLLKLSSENENMGLSRADNSVKIWRNLPISNPKPDIHNINAHAKFTQVIIWKWKTDRRMYDWQTDGKTHRRPTWDHNTPPLYSGGKSTDTGIFSFFFMKPWILIWRVSQRCFLWVPTGTFSWNKKNRPLLLELCHSYNN